MNLADTGSGLRSSQDQADEAFKRSIDSLTQLLASRPAEPPPALPDVEFYTREERFSFRRRSATAVLLLVAAIAAVSAGIYSFLHNAVPPQSHKIATVAAAPPPPAAIEPVASVSTIVPPPADAAPVSAAELPPLNAAVGQPLDARGISELQTRLGKIGFSPGPVDGIAGPLTVGAIKRYQQAKGRAQTGTVDSEVLDQLRAEASR